MQGAMESQLRHALQHASEDLEMKTSVLKQNIKLQSEINFLNSKNGNSNLHFQENFNLKKKLKTTPEVVELWKKDKEYLLEREKKLNQLTKETDFLSKQMLYKNECGLLRKTNRDLEAALSKREEELSGKTHVLELEGENTQKKAGKLQEKSDRLQEEKNTLQEEKNQLQKQMSQLQLKLNDLVFEKNSLNVKLSEARRLELDRKQNVRSLEMECCKLDEQLEQKKLEVKYPDKCFKYCQEPPRHERKPGPLNLELKGMLNAKCRQLEKMNLVLKEKEKQIEELKQDLSRPAPREMLALIPKRQWVNREPRNSIKALTAQVRMYQAKDEEYKSERETLADRALAAKRLYLEEKMLNSELWAVMATQSGGIPLPRSTHVLQKQARENQLDTKRPTPKPIAPCLPPSSKTSQPTKPCVNLGHTRSPTAPQTVSSDKKSDRTVTQKINDESAGKSRYSVLPPIPEKSSQVQSTAGRKKVFMTEQDQRFV